MADAKLSSDVARLKKLVSSKDAQIEALTSRCETLEEDLADARAARDRLSLSPNASPRPKPPTSPAPPPRGQGGEESCSPEESDLLRRVQQAEIRAAAAAEYAADAQASLAAAMDDFEMESAQLNASRQGEAKRELVERTLMQREVMAMEGAGERARQERGWSAATSSLLDDRIAACSLREEVCISTLGAELQATEAFLSSVLETLRDTEKLSSSQRLSLKLELEEAREQLTSRKLEVEELRDQLIAQTEAEIASLSRGGEDGGVRVAGGSAKCGEGSLSRPSSDALPEEEEEEVVVHWDEGEGAHEAEQDARSRWDFEMHRAGVGSYSLLTAARMARDVSEGGVSEARVLLLAPPPKMEAPSVEPSPRSTPRSHPPLHQLQHTHPKRSKPHSQQLHSQARQTKTTANSHPNPSPRSNPPHPSPRPLADPTPRSHPLPHHHPPQNLPSPRLPAATPASTPASVTSRAAPHKPAGGSSCNGTPAHSARLAGPLARGSGPPGEMGYWPQQASGHKARQRAQAQIEEMLRAQESALRAVADL